MPDTMDQNNLPSNPTTPPLADPQAMVDEALTPPVPPAPEPVAPPTAPPTPPPAPEPAPATPPVAMGDDTPLAFVTPPSSAPTTPTPGSLGTSVPMDAIPPAPLPAPEQPKKKKGLKVVGLIAGFFVMLGVVGLASYGMLGKDGLIAYVNKFTRDSTGKVIVNPNWDPDAIVPGGKTQEEERNEALGIKQEDNGSGLPAEKAGSPNNCGASYAWCGGGISKCVSFDALEDAGGGCNKYGEVKYGIASVYGANPGKTSCDPAKVASELATECNCGGTTYCFDRRGDCDSTDITRLDGSVVDTGFCGLVGSIPKGSTQFKEYDGLFCTQADVAAGTSGCSVVGELKYEYGCTINGCSTTDSSCKIVGYTCNSTVSGNSCTDSSSQYVQGSMRQGSALNFTGACGKVEQIDVMCGEYKMSRTRINSECKEKEESTITTTTVSPSPSPSPSPVMACVGLTQAPVAPRVGDKVTFTCTGTITPSTAGTLSYKFRYSINNAATVAMVNKTATTAELNVAACGEYRVECQTCATISGVLTCDPNWIGATQ